ncbi:hypothetical protein OROGR_012251 [Orobanche gracilis]
MQRHNVPSACASCKHQRKKCTNKCVLAPFFPAGKAREFLAVHKVFGVSNVTKIITNLEEDERKVAVDSLIWEALCRQRDPVLGPYGDYRRICEELRLYKSQFQQYCHHQGLNMGWTNTNSSKVVNNNNVGGGGGGGGGGGSNNFHGSAGNSMFDFCPYGYSSHNIRDTEKLRAEMENGSALILPQQHLTSGFNQQYIITGTEPYPNEYFGFSSMSFFNGIEVNQNRNFRLDYGNISFFILIS